MGYTRNARFFGRGWLTPLLVLGLGVWRAAAVDLTPLLAAPGPTVILDSSTAYTVAGYQLAADKTILCNGAQVTVSVNPITVSGTGVRLVVDDCRIDGTSWALLAATDGAQLVVRNGTAVAGVGTNSAMYVKGAIVDIDGGTIDHFQVGVLAENSEAALHGVVITNTNFAVQSFAGALTLDGGCELTNLDPVTPGAGVDLHPSPTYPSRAATAVVRDTTFTGFGNSVTIHPTAAQGLPPGTADIAGCSFYHPVISAIIAVDAANVHFANSRVVDAQTDGIFLQNSIGVIEDSQILNSLNTGVSFFGCPDGGAIRNSLVSGNAHQGVAVTFDPASTIASHGIRVVNNTMKDNVIANLLVDEHSDAVVQGNIFSGAPEVSVRFHEALATGMIAGLLLDSVAGLEVRGGTSASTSLSIFTQHDRYGALVRSNATTTFSHCAFEANGQDAAIPDSAVIADSGARLTLGRSTLGPASARGLYNKAGNTSTATANYWGDPSGPRLPGGSGGRGALLGWNAASRVTHRPSLATPPLDSRLQPGFSLTADTPTRWEPDIGLVLSLTGASGMTPIPAGLVAALRLRDSATLTSPAPPLGTFADGVVAVWAEFDLLSHTGSGTLRFQTAGPGQNATLYRLDADAGWTPLGTTWDDTTSAILYAPADPSMLHGVFAFGDGTGCPTARECLQPLLARTPCGDQLDPTLQAVIGRKVDSVIGKLTKAAAGTNVTRLVSQARKVLQRVERLTARYVRAKRNPLSAQCLDVITNVLHLTLQRLDAGTL